MGDVAEGQVKMLFGSKYCTNKAGQAAFSKLVNAIREAAGDGPIDQDRGAIDAHSQCFRAAGRQDIPVNGLLAKAENPDEIAGVSRTSSVI